MAVPAVTLAVMATLKAKDDPLTARRQRQARFARARVRAGAAKGHAAAETESVEQNEEEDDFEGEAGAAAAEQNPGLATRAALKVLVSSDRERASKTRRLAKLNSLATLWNRLDRSQDQHLAQLKTTILIWYLNVSLMLDIY